MATTEAHKAHMFAEHEAAEAAASIAGTAGGLALVILGILALDKIEPALLISIAVIVAGVMLMTDSAALWGEMTKSLSATAGRGVETPEVVSGLNAGLFAGLTGIVLGILAILGIAPETLSAIAVIVFGGAVLFDYTARVQVRALKMTAQDTPEHSARVALAVASSMSTAGAFAAVALITLGILALAGVAGDILLAVAFLAFGAYVFLEDSSVVGNFMTMIAG